MATCTINKHLRQLGTGVLTVGSNSVTSWVAGAGTLVPMVGRNIWITMTSGRPPAGRLHQVHGRRRASR